jgi:Isoleucyl-tRNA synthetase
VVDLADLSARLGVEVKDSTDIVIWTTTPWTLPANQAVALHAEIEYQLVVARGEDKAAQNFILAKDLVESATERYGFNAVEVIADFAGAKLENLVLQHPLIAERQVPVFWVNTSSQPAVPVLYILRLDMVWTTIKLVCCIT